MAGAGFRRALVLCMTLMSLTACGERGSVSADPSWLAALDAVKSAITASTGYPASSIELLASPVHIRVSISDSKLAQSDQATRENAATAVVLAVEKSMALNARFASVEEVSVAIIHPAEGSARGSHTEDVVDFRKGPNQRFALHIT